MSMLIPEAWEHDASMPEDVKAFYEYHASLMEPWDGPAAVAFTDGRVIGAKLDRNGLRPGRYLVTSDGLVVMASEAGVLPIKPEDIRMKGRLAPGRMLLVDTEQKRLISDEEVKKQLAARQPYAQWVRENQITLDHLPSPTNVQPTDHDTILMRQRAFGYTDEDLKTILQPAAMKGEEPVGSMGIDTPLACLSDKPQLLFNYFKQTFAQVTNPAIDPIREDLVMSLNSYIGREGNILDETPKNCHTLKLRHPIISNWRLEKLRSVKWGDFLATTLADALPRRRRRSRSSKRLSTLLCRARRAAIKSGYTLLILSDRGVDDEYAPIPSLLALSAVHNHLIREKTRNQVALIVESGEPREVMHFALLAGLWRERRESLPRHRNARRSLPRRPFPGRIHLGQGFQELHEGHRQGPAEDLFEDGHLDSAKLPGRSDFRGHRLEPRACRPLFHWHGFAHRRRGHRSARTRSADEASVRDGIAQRIRHRASRRRRISVSGARRAPPAESRRR